MRTAIQVEGARPRSPRRRSLAPVLMLALPLAAFFVRGVAGRAAPPARTVAVECGIDVLVASNFAVLAGKRVGLITNHTGLARDGRRTVDLLHGSDQLELVALFAPEHGFEGVLDSERIQDGRDVATGLRVSSLYGETRRPTPAMLAGIDVLVFDIQDIGTRFYTYVSTMGLALEAAAEAGIGFCVLDRPNPIGGVRVEGPVQDGGRRSFVGHHELPVRHGLTVGELAGLLCAERDIALDLEVVRIRGWRRDLGFESTGLPWVAPSPNMRRLVQAHLYPGIGLLEFTNVSVGRGTDTPFERLGAPWIDGVALAERLRQAALPGVAFVPVRFTPTASTHAGTACGGCDVFVTDWSSFESVRTGLHIACALRDLFGSAFESERYDRLLGDGAVFEALRSGATPQELCALADAEAVGFAQRRAPFLLYE